MRGRPSWARSSSPAERVRRRGHHERCRQAARQRAAGGVPQGYGVAEHRADGAADPTRADRRPNYRDPYCDRHVDRWTHPAWPQRAVPGACPGARGLQSPWARVSGGAALFGRHGRAVDRRPRIRPSGRRAAERAAGRSCDVPDPDAGSRRHRTVAVSADVLTGIAARRRHERSGGWPHCRRCRGGAWRRRVRAESSPKERSLAARLRQLVGVFDERRDQID